MDRSLFLVHGLDPQRFDLIVVKSPGAYARYFTWATRNFSMDVPGATSANLLSLPYRHCRRPMFPLEADTPFTPRVELFRTGGGELRRPGRTGSSRNEDRHFLAQHSSSRGVQGGVDEFSATHPEQRRA